MPLATDDFHLISASFELRYAPQFLVWDRSGLIWSGMAASFPDAATKQATPNAVNVRLARNLDGTVAIDRCYVQSTIRNPKLTELKDAAEALVPLVIRHLPIEQFTRIGLRLIYQKNFSSREQAADYLLQRVPVPHARSKAMNVDGRILEPQLAFRCEGDKLGFHVRLSAMQNEIAVEFPAEYAHLAPQANDLKLDRVTLDIDYYSHAMVPVDGIKPEDLIDNWLSVIKRDIAHAVAS